MPEPSVTRPAQEPKAGRKAPAQPARPLKWLWWGLCYFLRGLGPLGIAAALLPIGLALFTGLRFAPMYDEPAHKAFSEYLSKQPVLETIVTYKGSQNHEAKGPLYFLLAAAYGALLGFDLRTLRVLTLLFSITCTLAFPALLRLLSGGSGVTRPPLLPFTPYFLALSLTFMTDMPSLALLLMGMLGYLDWLEKRQIAPLVLGAICLTCAAYIRVEFLYALPGFAVACWLRGKLDRITLVFLLVPLMARLPLVLVWGGLAAPPAQLRPSAVALGFQPSHLVFALSVLGLYFWPFLLEAGATSKTSLSKPMLVLALMVTLACLAFPPRIAPEEVESYGGTIRSLFLAANLSWTARAFAWIVLSVLGLCVCRRVAAVTSTQSITVSCVQTACAVGVGMQLVRGPLMYERYMLEVTPLFLLLLTLGAKTRPPLLLWAGWSLALQAVQLLKNGFLHP